MTLRVIRRIFGWTSTILASILVGLLWLGSVYGGRIEGQFFPVVSGTHITRAQVTDQFSTRIWGRAMKERKCSFDRIEWYIGTPDAYAFVDLHIEEASKARVGGGFGFGPWSIKLTPEEIRTRSFATVFHRCHPFWVTETRFYP